MSVSEQQTRHYHEDRRFLSDSYLSEDKFLKEYKKYYFGKARSKEFYLLVLKELENAIVEGNIGNFKRLSKVIDYIHGIESLETLKTYYDCIQNSIRTTNLVILACKHGQVNILKYIFDNIKILENLSIDAGKNAIAPSNKDELCHDAFYYAILSSDVELLVTLIDKWPGDYFTSRAEELDEVLSRAYEELKWKNVSLSESMEIFVEKKLLNLRFFSNRSGKVFVSVRDRIANIKERVDLVVEKISFLRSEYSNTEKIDEKFLFIARFIAQNIHMLKRQLRFTYDRLPWEEVEFCLVSFISSHLIQQDINLFYRTVLNKNKILTYLDDFSKKLECEMYIVERVDVNRLADLPKLNRDLVVKEIIRNAPKFEQLYNDYQQIRDIHSLEKINEYLNLALSADPKEKQGQLIITRALQVIGEYLKNTLESPKLSNATSELLILSLPQNTRKVVIDLRNSLSHANSLSKRTEIEANTDSDFFAGVQKDTKTIDNVITNILYNNKMKMIKTLLMNIISSKNLDEMQRIADVLKNVELDKMTSNGFKVMEHEHLEKLISDLSNAIIEKTEDENKLLVEISTLVSSIKNESENIKTDYALTFSMLSSFMSEFSLHHTDIDQIRLTANNTLVSMFPQKEEKSHRFEEITNLCIKIYRSAMPRLQDENLDLLNKSASAILCITLYQNNDIKWIEKLKEKLCDESSFIPVYKQSKTSHVMSDDECDKQLVLKLSELKTILSNDQGDEETTENLPSYKKNKKLQAAVEMLVLDIMSILGLSDNYLENNLFFLDDNTPLLTGKCLRNHLAHGNSLLDILISDPSKAIFLNAKKLISENVVENKKKVGKLVRDDPSKLKDKYDQCLSNITNQQEMFSALEAGDLEKLKICLAKGADIKARSINSWSALHFACCGPSLEVVKFIGSNADVKDINGRSPLHTAAAYGRTDIVEFLITKAHVPVDICDNNHRTPLQFAAENGHKGTVEILLKYNANTNCMVATASYAPLHYAIQQCHVDVALVLLEKEANVDANEAAGGCTSLHIAAEVGCLEVVNVLLNRGANVNARHDKGAIPLHPAAIKGHLEIVKALILKGADVNARTLDGCSPLLYAVMFGHREIIEFLLEHGANVNVADKNDRMVPLHYAVQNGCEDIVEILLSHNANVHVTDATGETLLHYAAQYGHLKIAEVLIKRGVSIHAKDENRSTALHNAAKYGHKEIAHLLIRNGAEINAKDARNLTPLHMTAVDGHDSIADLLIKNKAKIDAKDGNGLTPLYLAAQTGKLTVVDVLVKNKAEVNGTVINGQTPLHIACRNGHKDVAVYLIKNRAQVRKKCHSGLTPLHAAVSGSHKEIVEYLIKNGAELNVKSSFPTIPPSKTKVSATPLEVAVFLDDVEIVEILAANGANVDVKTSDVTPLLSCIKKNNKELVQVLLANGANVDGDCGEPLLEAVVGSTADIVDILLKNNARIDLVDRDGVGLLYSAASRGHKEIVSALIAKGAKINALVGERPHRQTPLFVAVQEGHKEVVEVLIANKADVDFLCEDCTALYAAAICGHGDIAQILLSNGAKINRKNDHNKTPLDFAIKYGHLSVVKVLLQHQEVNMNAKNGESQSTMLHLASGNDNLEVVKYLVDQGCDIHARDSNGMKPIHYAARGGYKDIVEFFLSKGLHVDESGASNYTPLQYAVLNNRLDVVKYLIAKGANINIKSPEGSTLMHNAATMGSKDIMMILLDKGVPYNTKNNHSIQPIHMSLYTNDPTFTRFDKNLLSKQSKDTENLLISIDELFEAIKHEDVSMVEECIKAGAFVNAKYADPLATPLHFATVKGNNQITLLLLQNQANPNAVGSCSFTPLHHAAIYSHLECAKSLLHHNAIYNAVSNEATTPVKLASDQSIINLFNLIDDMFKKVKNNDNQVIKDLNKIKDPDTLKAIMNACCDTENNTLLAIASRNNFRLAEKLKQVCQGNVSAQIDEGEQLIIQGDYQSALSIFKRLFEKRKLLFGPNNLATLDIQKWIGKALYKQGNYQAALDVFEEVFGKQKNILGLDNQDTLDTRSAIALVMFRQDKFDDASNLFQEVYQKQKDLLGSDHEDTMNTQFHFAILLQQQGKHHEAMNIYRTRYKMLKSTLGSNNITTVSALNNIGATLTGQGKFEEALEIYKDVLEKKKSILGINHTDTLRTLSNIGAVLLQQHKHQEALKTFQEVLDIQKKTLQRNHPDILITQLTLADLLLSESKFMAALQLYKECYDQRLAVFGHNHPSVEIIAKKIDFINLTFKIEGRHESDIFQYLQGDINIAANDGDVKTVKRLLENGVDANDRDIDGRTPLHYAVSKGHIEIVNILLKNGADVTCATNKGNTPLHTATSSSNNRIIEMLLKHVDREKLNDFINAKTASEGTSSLHVAAKNGSLNVVKLLLKYGATYDIKNKQGKTPIDVSKDPKTISLLKFTDEVFKSIKNGSVEVLNKLKALKPDEFSAVTNARNAEGHGLLQVAIVNKQKNIASLLLGMLKKTNQS